LSGPVSDASIYEVYPAGAPKQGNRTTFP
jgi:hypothetical protein